MGDRFLNPSEICAIQPIGLCLRTAFCSSVAQPLLLTLSLEGAVQGVSVVAQGRVANVRAIRNCRDANAHRELRRPFGEDYWYEYSEVHDNAKLNRFTPHRIIDEKTKRRPSWFRKDEYEFPMLAAQVAKLERAGGLVGVGSHGQLQGLGYR